MCKENKEIELKAMEIILHAGDGRLFVMQALDAIAEDDFQQAEIYLESAYAEIQKAHNVQTLVIQGVASGELEQIYSILFAHAQDTLMTIYSEYNLANKLFKITESIIRKIQG